jgi:hypothetical protein
VKERPGVVDQARRRRWVPKQAVEPFHEDRDPGAPLRRPRIAGQDVKDDRHGSLGGGGDDIFRDHRVIAPRELGRPGGMGGRPPDVAHLRRLREIVRELGRQKFVAPDGTATRQTSVFANADGTGSSDLILTFD